MQSLYPSLLPWHVCDVGMGVCSCVHVHVNVDARGGQRSVPSTLCCGLHLPEAGSPVRQASLASKHQEASLPHTHLPKCQGYSSHQHAQLFTVCWGIETQVPMLASP